jgi:hypothetical protein
MRTWFSHFLISWALAEASSMAGCVLFEQGNTLASDRVGWLLFWGFLAVAHITYPHICIGSACFLVAAMHCLTADRSGGVKVTHVENDSSTKSQQTRRDQHFGFLFGPSWDPLTGLAQSLSQRCLSHGGMTTCFRYIIVLFLPPRGAVCCTLLLKLLPPSSALFWFLPASLASSISLKIFWVGRNCMQGTWRN